MDENPDLVYIAHPIGGDVEKNMERVRRICEEVHAADVYPAAPYLLPLEYLDDEDQEDRALGMRTNEEYFHRDVFDAVWLCGPYISEGMRREIELAMECGMDIFCYNEELEPELQEILQSLGNSDA